MAWSSKHASFQSKAKQSNHYIPTNDTKWFKDSTKSCRWNCLTASEMTVAFSLWIIQKNSHTKNTFVPHIVFSFSQVIWQEKHLSHWAEFHGNNTHNCDYFVPFISVPTNTITFTILTTRGVPCISIIIIWEWPLPTSGCAFTQIAFFFLKETNVKKKLNELPLTLEKQRKESPVCRDKSKGSLNSVFL